MENGAVYLKKGEGRSMKAGGPWVYDNEVERIEGEPLDGDVVSVHDYNGFCLGKGFLNRRSKLRVRMLTRNRNQEIDEDFLRTRVENAWEYRKKVVDTGSCRVIFGEADFLPGLVVDKFSDVLVVQSLALGMDRYKSFILETLKELMAKDGISIRGIYERSDAKVREQEGMPRVKGFLSDPFDTKVEIVENGVRYFVDVAEGQKTGFFLDQKYNRKAIWPLCPGAEVLDCFTHTGSFALNAGLAGASHVLGVDASELGVAQARENAALNGVGRDRYTVRWGDVVTDQALRQELGGPYDVVVANIVADVIISLAPQVRHFLKEDGWFLTSGIIDDRADEAAAALVAAGWNIVESCTSEGWYCYICR